MASVGSSSSSSSSSSSVSESGEVDTRADRVKKRFSELFSRAVKSDPEGATGYTKEEMASAIDDLLQSNAHNFSAQDVFDKIKANRASAVEAGLDRENPVSKEEASSEINKLKDVAAKLLNLLRNMSSAIKDAFRKIVASMPHISKDKALVKWIEKAIENGFLCHEDLQKFAEEELVKLQQLCDEQLKEMSELSPDSPDVFTEEDILALADRRNVLAGLIRSINDVIEEKVKEAASGASKASTASKSASTTRPSHAISANVIMILDDIMRDGNTIQDVEKILQSVSDMSLDERIELVECITSRQATIKHLPVQFGVYMVGEVPVPTVAQLLEDVRCICILKNLGEVNDLSGGIDESVSKQHKLYILIFNRLLDVSGSQEGLIEAVQLLRYLPEKQLDGLFRMVVSHVDESLRLSKIRGSYKRGLSLPDITVMASLIAALQVARPGLLDSNIFHDTRGKYESVEIACRLLADSQGIKDIVTAPDLNTIKGICSIYSFDTLLLFREQLKIELVALTTTNNAERIDMARSIGLLDDLIDERLDDHTAESGFVNVREFTELLDSRIGVLSRSGAIRRRSKSEEITTPIPAKRTIRADGSSIMPSKVGLYELLDMLEKNDRPGVHAQLEAMGSDEMQYVLDDIENDLTQASGKDLYIRRNLHQMITSILDRREQV